MYRSLATDKLLGLASSKEQDLIMNQWADEDQQRALDTLIQLAGFAKKTGDDSIPNPYSSDVAHIEPAEKVWILSRYCTLGLPLTKMLIF